MAIGIVVSLMKGADKKRRSHPRRRAAYPLAGATGVRSSRGALRHAPFTALDCGARGGARALRTWLGLFAFKHVEYSNELWWQFELHAEASRMLRATVGARSDALAVRVRAIDRLRAARGARSPPTQIWKLPRRSSHADRDAYRASYSCATKRFSSTRDKYGFVMYGVQGRTWAALGDPVGPPNRWVGSSACFWRNATTTAAFQCFTRFHEITWIGTRMWG